MRASRQARRTKESALAPLPQRAVRIEPAGGIAAVGDFGVAVVGNGVPTTSPEPGTPGYRGKALAGWHGAAIAGDFAAATASKICVALAGSHAEATVGDDGMARAMNGSFACADWNSMARIDDAAWALTMRAGVAVARRGVAESLGGGIAAALVGLNPVNGERGTAIAGPAGIAVAFDEGVLVRAGRGGALAGFWLDPGKTTRLTIASVYPNGPYLPDTFYRFEGGAFVALKRAELAKAGKDVETWKARWLGSAKRRRSESARRHKGRTA